MTKRLSDYIESSRRECLKEDDVKRIVELTIASFLNKLVEDVKYLRKSLDELVSEVNDLKTACMNKNNYTKNVRLKEACEKGRSKLIERIKLLISDEGFILLSRLSDKLRNSSLIFFDVRSKRWKMIR